MCPKSGLCCDIWRLSLSILCLMADLQSALRMERLDLKDFFTRNLIKCVYSRVVTAINILSRKEMMTKNNQNCLVIYLSTLTFKIIVLEKYNVIIVDIINLRGSSPVQVQHLRKFIYKINKHSSKVVLCPTNHWDRYVIKSGLTHRSLVHSSGSSVVLCVHYQ